MSLSRKIIVTFYVVRELLRQMVPKWTEGNNELNKKYGNNELGSIKTWRINVWAVCFFFSLTKISTHFAHIPPFFPPLMATMKL